MAEKPTNEQLMIEQARAAYRHLTRDEVKNPSPEFELQGDQVYITRNKVLIGVYRPRSKQFMAPRKY